MLDDEKSRAVVLYLSRGRSPFPKEDPDALISTFGSGEGGALIQYVRALLREANEFRLDWSQHTLASGTKAYEDDIRQHHSELSDAAVAALGWTVSHFWK